MKSNVTCVITNFKRFELVKKCYEKCKQVNYAEIIISSIPESSEHETWLKSLNIPIVISLIDKGCNKLWLDGVKLVKTEYVHIVHDDDYPTRHFNQLIDLAKTSKFKAIMCDGYVLTNNDTRDRIHRSSGLRGPFVNQAMQLMKEDTLSTSPLACIFKTQHVLDVLTFCETIKNNPKLNLRKNMFVGNDLLLYLTSNDIKYIREPLVCYGGGEQSTTMDCINNGKLDKLHSCYNAMRHIYANDTYYKWLQSRG